MISNLLRIFITKQAINKMQSNGYEQLAEQQSMQEQTITQITNREDAEAYIKQLKREEQERIRYCSRPIMALERAANMKAFFPIILIIGIIIIIGSIVLAIHGLLDECNRKYLALGISMAIFGVGLLTFFRYAQHYLENTMCLYYADRICIKKYRKKDIIITYDEIKECLVKKKIRIHNGRFEYPYKRGYIHIYTWGNSVKDGFYKFINDKCGIKMPKIEKKEKDVVRKTGIGWALYAYMGLGCVVISVILGFIGCTSDYGFHLGAEFWKVYMDYLFSLDNIFGVLAIIFIVPGIILKFAFYFPARKHFAKYRDIIKVSLF